MQKLQLPTKTLVSSVRPDSDSLRTVIPQSIAQMLKLSAGDNIVWDFEIANNEVIVRVKKGKK